MVTFRFFVIFLDHLLRTRVIDELPIELYLKNDEFNWMRMITSDEKRIALIAMRSTLRVLEE